MHSSSAVRMAVGCLVELAFKVAAGEIKVSGEGWHAGWHTGLCPYTRPLCHRHARGVHAYLRSSPCARLHACAPPMCMLTGGCHSPV